MYTKWQCESGSVGYGLNLEGLRVHLYVFLWGNNTAQGQQGIVPHTCISQSNSDIMHNLVAYQWFATYIALFTLPYLGHHWKGTTEIGVFLIGKALVVKTDFLPNRDDLGGFIHIQTWRCRFPDGTQNNFLQCNIHFWNVH